MTTRRAFLRGLVAAPAVVAASSLMPISAKLLLGLPPKLWCDGIHDDGPAIRAMIKAAEQRGGGLVLLPNGKFFMSESLYVPPKIELAGRGRDTVLIGGSDKPVVTVANGSMLRDLSLQFGGVGFGSDGGA